MHSVSSPWGASALTCSPQNRHRISRGVPVLTGIVPFSAGDSGRSGMAGQTLNGKALGRRWNPLFEVAPPSFGHGPGVRRAEHSALTEHSRSSQERCRHAQGIKDTKSRGNPLSYVSDVGIYIALFLAPLEQSRWKTRLAKGVFCGERPWARNASCSAAQR